MNWFVYDGDLRHEKAKGHHGSFWRLESGVTNFESSFTLEEMHYKSLRMNGVFQCLDME